MKVGVLGIEKTLNTIHTNVTEILRPWFGRRSAVDFGNFHIARP